MNEPTTSKMKIGWRYSPSPREAYGLGSASSQFLASEAAWNLAWLSHEFQNPKARTKPQFTVAVRGTLAVILSTGDIDVLGLTPPESRLGALMRLPPITAVDLIKHSRFHAGMPLYQLLGQKWLSTLDQQIHHSRVEDPVKVLDRCIDDPAADTQEACLQLKRFVIDR